MLMPPPPPPSPGPDRPPRAPALIGALLAITAVAALGVPLLIISQTSPPRAKPRLPRPMPHRVIPRTQLPPVEPLAYAALSPADAVAYNASIPYSTAPNPAARAFRLPEGGASLDRAVDCLAAAVLYEAGDDTVGERAVAQVVINRVRHPAFPKSICGVVFEGAERATGCQFTFTCDGALLRHAFSDAAWTRARAVAQAALSGAVYRPVGHATHYHTNWVVPYWSASLDKVSAVGTHLFFRWSGWWGTPPAFNRAIDTDEPAIAQLAAYSPAHRAASGLADGALANDDALIETGRKPAQPLAADPNAFLVTIDRAVPADELPALAAFNCGDRPYCKFMVWLDKAQTPTALPLGGTDIAAMGFSYLRDRSYGYEKALWNCTLYPRADKKQCMKPQLLSAPPRDESLPRPEYIGPRPELLVPKPELIRPAPPVAVPGKRLGGTFAPPAPAPAPSPAPATTPR